MGVLTLCMVFTLTTVGFRMVLTVALFVSVDGVVGDGEGVGWTFAPAAIEPMVAAVSSAVKLYREEPDKWRALQLRGMDKDVSWERAAQQYEIVLTEAMVDTVQFATKK